MKSPETRQVKPRAPVGALDGEYLTPLPGLDVDGDHVPVINGL